MIVIALGANLSSSAGPPQSTLRIGLNCLSENGVKPVSVSRLFRTPAWPDPGDPPFVNAVAAVETALPPEALMRELLRVEDSFGRIRTVPNAPRTLDLDLIDYHGMVMTGALSLPHPRVSSRAFVLIPLADVDPDWHHPVTGRSLSDLIRALPAGERQAVVPIGPLDSVVPATRT